jgi:hypothetical protein
MEADCNAHPRRNFVVARRMVPARTAAALGYYRQRYAIENESKAELARITDESDKSAYRDSIPDAGSEAGNGA